jgi:hypothetical protein
MRNLTPDKALVKVREAAEKICNDETAAIGTVSPGDVIRQGDIYIVAIRELPKLSKPIKDRQLAPGTTPGSRHVLVGDCEVYEADKAEVMAELFKVVRGVEIAGEQLIGPVFKTIGQVEVDHPEHGNRVLPAGECFAVVYQRAFAEEVRRQAD